MKLKAALVRRFVSIWSALIILIAVISGCAQSQDWSVQIGDPVPDFNLVSANTNYNISKESLAGKPYVIAIFATWCPPCRDELGILEKSIWQKFRDRGAHVIGVNYGDESADDIKQFAESNGLSFPLLSDFNGELRKKLGVAMVPQTVVVGPDGNIIDLHVGFQAETMNTITTTLNSLLK